MKSHHIYECGKCDRKRWIFYGWYERHDEDRDLDVQVSFCSQDHRIEFKVGWVNAIMMDIYLPIFEDWLSHPNPLSQVIKSERR